MRLFLGVLFLVIVCIAPAYGIPTGNISNQTLTGNISIQNSTLFDKLLNIEVNTNNCQKNVTENCQVVSSKLDNLTNTVVKIKNTTDLDDDYAKISLGLTAVSLWFVFWVFFVQDKQSKDLKKLVIDVHDFSQEEMRIKEVKRKRYSKMMLFGLRLIEYEIDGMIVHQRFRVSDDSEERTKYSKQEQIKYYEKAQKRFLEMNLEFDVLLEFFNETIETQYRRAWDTLRTPSLYVNFDDSQRLWQTINNIGQAFSDLKNSIIVYVSNDERRDYSDLFDPEKYRAG